MSAFGLKIIAVITMFIDHLGYTIFGKLSFFNYIINIWKFCVISHKHYSTQ